MFHSLQPADLNFLPMSQLGLKHIGDLHYCIKVAVISLLFWDRYRVLFSDWSITRQLDQSTNQRLDAL